MSSVRLATRLAFSMDSSSRLRSCMIFWLFSGLLQKSGDEICCSSLTNLDFCVGASKIPPHGNRLFAEGEVFPFKLFDSHRSIQF